MARAYAAHLNWCLRLGRSRLFPLLFLEGFWAAAALAAFPDPQLDDAVHRALSVPLGQRLSSLRVQALTNLSAPNQQITNLSGLASAINLAVLRLGDNAVSDLTPIQRLTQLTTLDLAGNNVGDISSVAALTNLSWFDLSGNPINDYSSLSNLNNLTRLSVHDGGITNLALLQNLQQLTELNLYNNQLMDISPLTNLTSLTCLDLRWNAITNPDVLAQATNLTRLYLGGNGLTNVDFLTNLTGLTFLNLDQNQITNCSRLIALTNLTYLVISHNPTTNYGWLSTLTNLVNLELRGNSVVDLGFMSALVGLRYADLAYNNITSLAPLAGLTNLSLVLDGNTNLSYSTVSSLANPSRLWLNGIPAGDLTFLASQPHLTALGLENSGLTKLAPLAGLTNLQHLGLSWNPALSLQPLATFTNLAGLRLEGNSITNAAVVANLVKLDFLSLNSNRISDLSPLTNLTGLKALFLSHNRLTNICTLPSLANPCFLDVSLNPMDQSAGSTNRALVRDLRFEGANVAYLPTNQLFLSVNLPTGPDWYIPSGRVRSVSLFIWDRVVPPGEWIFGADSSNQGIIPNTSISIQGANYNRAFTVTAATPGVTTLGLEIMDAPAGLTLGTIMIAHVLGLNPNFAVPDPNLDKTLSTALGLSRGQLTSVDLLDLPYLNAPARGITNLSGLEWATNLTGLNLTANFVSNLGALQNLTSLRSLNLSSNLIADLSPLAGLTNLNSLNLSHNAVTNFALLSTLTNLTALSLSGTSITNLSFLTNLGLLASLDLSSNKLTDISFLGRLVNLRWVSLSQNRLTDISALTNLAQLTNVDLSLNLLNANDPSLMVLANALNPNPPPQRGPPLIDIRTNWVIAPNLASSLPFTITDTGPADQRFGVSLAASTNLVCSMQGGPVLWTLTGVSFRPNRPWASLGWVVLAATNDVGFSVNTTVTVEVTPLLAVSGPFLGDPNLTWTSGGDAPWSVQNVVTHNGHPVAQSGALGNNQQSWLQTTVPGPGILTFWWKVSSEACCDYLQFTMGDQTTSIAGEVDWQFQEFFVPSGTQTLFWQYSKDPGVSDGLDAAWLDQVSFQPGTWLTFLDGPVGGQTDLILYCVPGRVYELQASTNLQSWSGLRPLLVGAAPFVLFTDTNANSNVRLYRLKDFSVTLDPPLLPINNLVQFVVHNLSGLPFDLQFSTNLLSWTTFATVTNTARDVTNTDVFATNSPVRFYRAVVHP